MIAMMLLDVDASQPTQPINLSLASGINTGRPRACIFSNLLKLSSLILILILSGRLNNYVPS
jgi:hypothetical protein